MRWTLDAGSFRSSMWKTLLFTGSLLACCTCSTSSVLSIAAQSSPLAKGDSPPLTLSSSVNGVLPPSWFHHVEAQSSVLVSTDGLPGAEYTGPQGSLAFRNLNSADSGRFTAVVDTRRQRRSATEQQKVKSDTPIYIISYPWAYQDTIRSELNYSVYLHCLASSNFTVNSWTFQGVSCRTGERLIIRQLSRETLGTYVCTVSNGAGQTASQSVSVAEAIKAEEDPIIEPDTGLSLTGASAVGLTVAACLGAVALTCGVIFTIVQSQRTNRPPRRPCC